MFDRKSYIREWNLKNKEKLALYQSRHAEKRKLRQKEYLKNNKEKLTEINKKWRKTPSGIASRKESYRKYRKNNRDKINNYEKSRLSIPEIRIAKNLRIRLSISMRSCKEKKNNKTMEYVGCSKEQLRSHIESQFKDGMNWENYGKWHIDHIVPISSFDLSKENQIFKAMNYINLQPLWAEENIKKSNKQMV